MRGQRVFSALESDSLFGVGMCDASCFLLLSLCCHFVVS